MSVCMHVAVLPSGDCSKLARGFPGSLPSTGLVLSRPQGASVPALTHGPARLGEFLGRSARFESCVSLLPGTPCLSLTRGISRVLGPSLHVMQEVDHHGLRYTGQVG